MNDCWIGPGALLKQVVIDKQVTIGAGAVVGCGEDGVVNQQHPDKLTNGISVVGRGAFIPERARIGRNVLVNSERDENNFPPDGVVTDGQTV